MHARLARENVQHLLSVMYYCSLDGKRRMARAVDASAMRSPSVSSLASSPMPSRSFAAFDLVIGIPFNEHDCRCPATRNQSLGA